MSNTSAAVLGLNAYNLSKQKEVEAKASSLITSILANRKSIKGYEKQIADEQAKVQELSLDEITQQSILGAELNAPLNQNQQTILNVIKKMNDDKQESVKLASQGHINRIKGYEQTIANLKVQIKESLKQLSELGADVATIESVVGSTPAN